MVFLFKFRFYSFAFLILIILSGRLTRSTAVLLAEYGQNNINRWVIAYVAIGKNTQAEALAQRLKLERVERFNMRPARLAPRNKRRHSVAVVRRRERPNRITVRRMTTAPAAAIAHVGHVADNIDDDDDGLAAPAVAHVGDNADDDDDNGLVGFGLAAPSVAAEPAVANILQVIFFIISTHTHKHIFIHTFNVFSSSFLSIGRTCQ